ncbi:6-phosphofructokinase [candidate division KSB1 bacterium]|nr:6-phosphofructokinase [candidate division KSB1 bacterium]
MSKIRRVGVLTGGGDCPGLNAVIRAVTKSLILENNIEVMGIEDGFQGLIENRIRPLSFDDVSGILQIGGTILGTSNKANPVNQPVLVNGKLEYHDLSKQTIANFKKRKMDALVCIGGDGTMAISKELIDRGIPIVGVPKTIDNDIYGTDYTFGHDTAVTIAAEALDRIHTTAQSHHRVMLVETMGRYAGWLTLRAGLASGADLILLPELDYDLDVICDFISKRGKKGRRFSIIAVSEGAKEQGGERVVRRIVEDSPEKIRLGGIAIKLGNDIEDRTGLVTRATVLGHLQRGGSPTPFDRVLATRFGVRAADLAAAGQFNDMVALQGDSIITVPIAEVGGKTRIIPVDEPLLDVAEAVGSSLGVVR